jgi:hypothetical protein
MPLEREREREKTRTHTHTHTDARARLELRITFLYFAHATKSVPSWQYVTHLLYLRFLQRCCWRWKFSGMLHIRFVNFELTVHACYPAVLRFMSVLAQRTATECCKRVDPIAQAIVCRRFTAESRLRVDGSPCEICGAHSGSGTALSLSTSVVPCQLSFHKCSICAH